MPAQSIPKQEECLGDPSRPLYYKAEPKNLLFFIVESERRKVRFFLPYSVLTSHIAINQRHKTLEGSVNERH